MKPGDLVSFSLNDLECFGKIRSVNGDDATATIDYYHTDPQLTALSLPLSSLKIVIPANDITSSDISEFIKTFNTLSDFEASCRVARGYGAFSPQEIAKFPLLGVIKVKQYLLSLL